MKRALDILFVLLSFTFIFWPWCMALGSALCWFFGLPQFFAWDGDRVGFAMLWPFGATLVWVFFLKLSDAFC